VDSHRPGRASSPEVGSPAAFEKLLLTVPEAASLLRLSTRSVWRLMADPEAGFPKRRRIGGRTLLVRDELLAFLDVEGQR